MPTYSPGHRRLSPGRESVGSDLYTVLRYDPVWQICDLAPASTNQRGTLSRVPVACGFGGAAEFQEFHQPAIPITSTDRFGRCDRGPRWGVNLPIQPGDKARVTFLGENQSDPVIVGFLRGQGNYGIPWLADRLLGASNHYTEQLPPDDALPGDRLDVLLPTGVWLRSTERGSVTLSLPPVEKPKSFATLNADGTIRIETRGEEEDYALRIELDPSKPRIRIINGSGDLEDASYMEFDGDDVIVRAKKKFQVYAEDVRFDVWTPQLSPFGGGGGGLFGALGRLTSIASMAAPFFPQVAAAQLGMQAIGQGILGGSGIANAVQGVLSNSNIAPNILNIIEAAPDIVENPLQFVSDRIPTGGEIAEVLSGQLGRDAMLGSIMPQGELNLNVRDMVQNLRLPGTILQDVQEITDNFPGGLDAILDVVQGNTSLEDLLPQVASTFGRQILNHLPIDEALADVRSQAEELGLGGALDDLIGGIENFQLPNLSGLGDIESVARRLGDYALRGNDFLGGAMRLFDVGGIESLIEDPDILNRVLSMAGGLEGVHTENLRLPLLNGDFDWEEIISLPEGIEGILDELAILPPEVRDIIRDIPDDIREFLPRIAEQGLGAVLPLLPPGIMDERFLGRSVGQWLGDADRFLREGVRPEVAERVANLDGLVIANLGNMTPVGRERVLDVPSFAGSAVPGAGVASRFARRGGSGRFEVRSRDYKRKKDPIEPRSVPPLPTHEKQQRFEARPVQRYQPERGRLNFPNYFNNPRHG